LPKIIKQINKADKKQQKIKTLFLIIKAIGFYLGLILAWL